MRAAEYRPEFSTEQTAVSVTALMIAPAAGMPYRVKTCTNGPSTCGSGSWFQGTITTMRKTAPTKNSRMRQITVVVAWRTPFAGSSASAAAMTAISVPK